MKRACDGTAPKPTKHQLLLACSAWALQIAFWSRERAGKTQIETS